MRAGQVGAAVPGKVRLAVDLAVESHTARGLAAPRGARAFAGAAGPMLALVAVEVPATPGGVATVDGTTVVVRTPNAGTAVAGPGWQPAAGSGGPAGVQAWADAGAPLAPGAATVLRGLALDVDPTVRAVRLRLAVLATPRR